MLTFQILFGEDRVPVSALHQPQLHSSFDIPTSRLKSLILGSHPCVKTRRYIEFLRPSFATYYFDFIHIITTFTNIAKNMATPLPHDAIVSILPIVGKSEKFTIAIPMTMNRQQSQ